MGPVADTFAAGEQASRYRVEAAAAANYAIWSSRLPSNISVLPIDRDLCRIAIPI